MRIPTSPRTDSVNLDAADDARLLGLGEAMAAVGGLGHTSWLCYPELGDLAQSHGKEQ